MMTEQSAVLVHRKLEQLSALLSASLELWEVEGEVALDEAGIVIRLGPKAIAVWHEQDNPVASWWVTLDRLSPTARLRESPCSGCLGVLSKVHEWSSLDA